MRKGTPPCDVTGMFATVADESATWKGWFMDRFARRTLAATMLVVSMLVTRVSTLADVVVPTQHNDNFRTGANLAETQLTPANVGRLQRVDRYVDGFINTQILYAHGVRTPSGPRNLAFVATSSNSIYAFDADDRSSAPQGGLVWRVTLRDPDATARPWGRGINATPVLEFANGNGTIDVLYSTANEFPWNSVFVKDELALLETLDVRYYLVKLDLATGAVVHPPVALRGSVERTGTTPLDFVPRNESDTASLLLDHGYIYASFSARQNENVSEYYGWMLRYRAADLSYAGAFNTVPHAWDWQGPGHPSRNPKAPPPLVLYDPAGGRLEPWGDWVANGGALTMASVGEGGGIWQGGAGPAADRDGNVYVLTGNGHYEPQQQSYGDSIVKLRSTADAFGVADAWAPPEQLEDEQYDVDLGSAGPLVVDGPTSIIAGGKTAFFYVVDSALRPLQPAVLGGVNNRVPDPDNKLRFQTWNQGPHLHGSPTLWRVSPTLGYVYEWAEKDYLKKYALDLTRGTFILNDVAHPWIASATAPLAAACDQLLCLNAMPGGMLALTANGTTNGIVWAILTQYDASSPAAIYAFDARTLRLLWHDPIGAVPHFAGPTVADGHVFVPTNSLWLRFSIYSLGATATDQRRLTGPTRPWTWQAQTAMGPMTSSVPDYALDPAFRARLVLPGVMHELPSGLIVSASYAVAGTDTYACTNAHDSTSCRWKRTDLQHAYRYDDRTQLASAAEIPLGPSHAYTSRLATSAWPHAADWQLLRRPGGVFGDAAYVLRTRTSNGAPPADPRAGDNLVPFTAVYVALVPGR